MPSGQLWGYYFGVLVLLVLGVLGVYNSREYRDAAINKQGNTAPLVHQKPPWFEGYAIDECGKILAPIKTNKDPYGITTEGRGHLCEPHRQVRRREECHLGQVCQLDRHAAQRRRARDPRRSPLAGRCHLRGQSRPRLRHDLGLAL